MSINGPISRGFIVKDRGAEPPEIGAGDDEEEDDSNEAGEIEDGGLCEIREGWAGGAVCEDGCARQGAGEGKRPLLERTGPGWGWA